MFFLLFLIFLFFVMSGRCFGPWGWRRYQGYPDRPYGYGPYADPRQAQGPWSYGPPHAQPSQREPSAQPPVV